MPPKRLKKKKRSSLQTRKPNRRKPPLLKNTKAPLPAQFGSHAPYPFPHTQLTPSLAYRILIFRVGHFTGAQSCRFRKQRKSGTTESSSTGTTPSFMSSLTSSVTAPPSSRAS